MNTYGEGDAMRHIVLASTDGGLNWHGTNVTGVGGTLGTYAEGDALKVILLQSTDAGLSWTPVTSPGGGGGGADLTAYLGKQTLVGANASPTLFDPAGTSWDDGHAWLQFHYQSGSALLMQLGNGDPAGAGEGFVQFRVDAAPVGTGARVAAFTIGAENDAYSDGVFVNSQTTINRAGGASTQQAVLQINSYNAEFIQMQDIGGEVGLLAHAGTGQTAPLIKLQDESGGIALSVTPHGAMDMLEQSAPAAPAVNTGRLYTKDVGGKTALFVRFPTGAEQQIAIEP